MIRLYCGTTNAGKLREFSLISGEVEIVAVPGMAGIIAPEETGRTFAENASIKAAYYSGFVDGLVFADDSGLAVDVLDGAPGVYSARYAGESATDADNNARLLKEMQSVNERTGRFICSIAVARGGETLAVFEDFVEGRLLTEARGGNGFGYDPLFFYPPFGCTFGEATAEQKHPVSHRGKAMEKLIRWVLDIRLS